MPKRWLVVGGDGQIGRAVLRRARRAGRDVVATTRRPQPAGGAACHLDLAHDLSGWRPPEGIAVAVLCAAVTSVARCQADPAGTHAINVEALWTVSQALFAAGAFVVFPSTNLVFDGSVACRRAEELVCPTTEYGRQKAEVEGRLLAAGDQAAVVRLTKVLTPDMPLIAGWLEALKHGQVIRPCSDMVLSPLSLGFAAEVLWRVGSERVPRITQASGHEDITYAELAAHVAGRLGVAPDLVQPTTSAEAGLAVANVPRHTTLDTRRLRTVFALDVPGVWQTVDDVLGLSARPAGEW